MSAVDEIKEKIAYLELWLGVSVVALLSLIGWLVPNYETAKRFLVVLDMAAIAFLLVVIGVVHGNIQRFIRGLRSL